MRVLSVVCCCTLLIVYSCSTSKSPFSGKKTPHEKYSAQLTDAGLDKSIAGKLWFKAAENALRYPLKITIPYKETGFHSSTKPSASGYVFQAKRGEKISAVITTVPLKGFLTFIDVWQSISGKKELIYSSDTSGGIIQHTVKQDAEYILRIQTELLQSIEYTITINTGPSLAFPVDKSGNPKLISLWGVDRDGGARSHEGVDIGAKKRTPALASANGYITRVNENELGGKVVFLRDEVTGNNIYYAHLDSQMVQSGQRIKAGEVIGLVGNTGNARNTVPHLHFGIYSTNGPIDPLAFIDNKQKPPPEIKAPGSNLDKWMHITSATKLLEQPLDKSPQLSLLAKNDAVFLVAASAGFYKVRLPGGEYGFIPYNSVSDKNILTLEIDSDKRLLDEPDTGAPAKTILIKGNKITVKGNYKHFYLVNSNKDLGWIAR